MSRLTLISRVISAALTCSTSVAGAAQLRVDPVLLEMNVPAAAGTLNLRNNEDVGITVQTRVLRWTQADGKETLEPTTDVVASPPAVNLAPGADYIVRVVRVSKQPVRGEESYRVIVDQLPRAGKQANQSVNLLIRQSIPIFFRATELNSPAVTWSVSPEAGKLIVVASNAGDERLRIASLRLKDASGATISFGNGLVGYVLGRSTMSWTAPSYPRGFGASGPVTITAETDKGPTHAVAQSPVRR